MVSRLVRQANPQAHTVLITGARPEVDHLIDRLRSEGADAIYDKPFDVAALLATLKRLAG